MGWILENHRTSADMILGGAQVGVAESALQAEALACLFALKWSIEASLQRITILTDSQTLVDMIVHMDACNIQVLWTLKEIQRLGKTLNWCSILKVSRQQVQTAHDLANEAASTSISFSRFP